ncbi:MAG: SpoIIE family protein phosphatase [Clostridia bacterium]|nr:SpoIIE family protein phosphatase [Clostridia bacterium]
MKKFKNLVIGGIENKIFNLILLTVLLLGAAATLVANWHEGMLSTLTEETGKKQQESMADITGSVIDQVIRSNMDRITERDSQLADQIFRTLETQVTIMGKYAERFEAGENAADGVLPAEPDAAQDGMLCAKMLLAKGADPADAATARAIADLYGMSDTMVDICQVYGASNCYVGTPEGVTLMVDALSTSWIGEDGQVKSYDPRTRGWYQQAMEAGGRIFTDIYLDNTTGSMCVTCAMPVYGPDGALRAVVGADRFLDDMQATVAASTAEGGFLVVVNQNGHIIMSPQKEGILSVRVGEDAIDLRTSNHTQLATLLRDAARRKTAVRRMEIEGKQVYAMGAPMKTLGWVLMAVFDAEAAEQPVRAMESSYEQIESEARAAYLEKSDKFRTILWVLGAAVLLIVLGGSLILGKRIVRPLNLIMKRISELREESSEFKMEDSFRTGDEVQALAESFADISHKAVLYIEEVKRITAEKERVAAELQMANLIQNSMLPHIFPAFPERREFDLYASMDPAREVGGDFYDFFLVDKDHLCMVIADVSGKGIPAALFMMISKVILQSCAMLGKTAEEILTKTNEALCSNNQAEMFVTVWLGILEISTGKMVAANAGHEFPALRRAGGRFELFRDRHGFVIGGMSDITYHGYEMQLQPGDQLFVYTDGVPEATNAQEELFGTDRMLDALNQEPETNPEKLLSNVRGAVDAFVKDAEQFDDMTMLSLTYKGARA